VRGKWAQGIVPRNFRWIIKDQLAICERPGGYGPSHRRIRRQEEIIWIRENGFDRVISLIGSPHNLHNYDELGVAWLHRPLTRTDSQPQQLDEMYAEIAALLEAGEKLILHGEEVADRIAGFVGGYLVWSGLVPDRAEAIIVIERMLERQMGPEGRAMVLGTGDGDAE